MTHQSKLSAYLLLVLLASPLEAATQTVDEAAPEPTDVIFVGNNWEGMIDVIDADSYEHLGRINGIPDREQRVAEINDSLVHRLVFRGIRSFIGEGHNQYVDDMYSSHDGRLLVVSRPSFADVVAIDTRSGEIAWRFEVDGYRSDHMAMSPDGTEVARVDVGRHPQRIREGQVPAGWTV